MRRVGVMCVSLVVLMVTAPQPAVAAGASISSFSPMSGTIGTVVTINGSNFGGATSVTIGGKAATFTGNTGTQINATVPAGAGTGKIVVSTPGGNATSGATFTVTPGLVLSDTRVPQQSLLRVTAVGLGASKFVDIYLDATPLQLVQADRAGTFSNVAVTIPRVTERGGHWISAVARGTGTGVQKNIFVSAEFNEQGGGPRHRGRQPLERILDAESVHDLEPAWIGTTDQNTSGMATTVADGFVFVSGSRDPGNSAKLYAFPVGCATGGAACSPSWSATLAIPASAPRASVGPVAIANGLALAVAGARTFGQPEARLFAFRDTCATGGGTCTPVWRADLDVDLVISVTVSDGVAYTYSSSGVSAYSLTCGTGGAFCSPLWVGPTAGGSAGVDVAVGNGVVYATDGQSGNTLYAFGVGCAIGGAKCSPLWTAPMSSPAQSLAVSGNTLYALSGSDVQAFAADGCGSSACSSLWTLSPGANSTAPAIGGNLLFVASGSTLRAYSTTCGACTPVWTAPLGSQGGGTIVANGLVYVETSDGLILAFDSHCNTGGGGCTRQWSVSGVPNNAHGLSIADGTVYFVQGFSPNLHAWEIDGGASVPFAPRPSLRSLKPDRPKGATGS